jgi:hypothetical protein
MWVNSVAQMLRFYLALHPFPKQLLNPFLGAVAVGGGQL